MATPVGAIPRDLQQMLRDMQRQIDALTGVVLRRKQLGVTEGDFAVSGGGRVVVEDGGEVRVIGEDTIAVLAPDSVNIATLAPDGETWIAPNMVLQPNGFVAANGTDLVVFRIDDDGNAVMTSSNQTMYLPPNIFTGFGGTTRLQGAVRMSGLPTTGAGANLNWSLPDGALSIVTSTQRHKTNVAPADVDTDAVLSLQEVMYDRLDDPDPDNPTRYLGFIAERAEELGLTAWVIYDAEGLPWSFDYSGFAAVAHHAVLRKHAAELAAERERNDKLEARLDALEAQTTTRGRDRD